MIREANKNDLDEILQLYLYLHEKSIPEDSQHLRSTWDNIINFAKKIAEENHCYKMMLLTGSKEESTLNFYRNAGYNSSDKTAFVQWIDM